MKNVVRFCVLWAVVVIVAFILLLPKDVVTEDKEHKVICVSRGERLLGCMDTKGNQVSNTHFNHE